MIPLTHGILQSGKVVTVAGDSISVSPTTLEFYDDGSPLIQDYTDLTASGSWTSTKVDQGFGTAWFSAKPSSSSTTSIAVYITVDSTVITRNGRITFTRGSATADLDITQYDFS